MSTKESLLRGPKTVVEKTRNITRTMTTATALCSLPKGSRILRLSLGGTASDAGTTATVSIGTTSASSNELINAYDVKTAGTGTGMHVLAGAAGVFPYLCTADTTIYALYAETGAASAAGSWKLVVEYSANSVINDGTV